ncbi:helix-turn-helix domain-containing protein [Hugonella massiliensis]|jgi:excisionase family DNA binding protein|uniref:helix-turn-helix domain-containing protein n=1 Tax=Hugonella massiliensis TaxID=1720315 RepID=UPI00073ED452|nr:helix-turn-helix domain-containing protein [Hugonella massiliensis]MDD7203812.1 helix-turn-helix domain-containing protein [Coriobacteriaceae bacterium]
METTETSGRRADEGRVITFTEAAKILGTSYTTVYRLAESGALRAFRIRHSWRTSTGACEDYIAEQFRKQASICQSTESD